MSSGRANRIVFLLAVGFALLRGVEARTINARYGKVFEEFGVKALKKERYNAAKKYLRQAVYNDPGLSSAYYGLGYAYYKEGKFQEAFSTLQQASYLSDGYELDKILNLLGIICSRLGNVDRATFYISRAIYHGHHKQDAVVRYIYNLALIDCAAGDFQKAQTKVSELRHLKAQHFAETLEKNIQFSGCWLPFEDAF